MFSTLPFFFIDIIMKGEDTMDIEKVKVTLELQDKMSQKLKDISKQVTKLAKDVEKATNQMNSAFNKVNIGNGLSKSIEQFKKQLS